MSISTEQIRAFDKKGYLVIKNCVPNSLLIALRDATEILTERILIDSQRDREHINNVAIITHQDKQYIYRVNELFSFANEAFTRLLGLPVLQQLVTALAQGPAISIYESLLMKHRDDQQSIAWHRDMCHDRHSRIFTVGVYLDDSMAGDGALSVIPCSHLSSKTVCEFTHHQQPGELKSVELSAKPGDIIIHDVMLVHSSSPLKKQSRRRTVYFEFRSLEHVNNNDRFTSSWIQNRETLVNYAKQCWEIDPIKVPEPESALLNLYQEHVRIEAGEYCACSKK